MDGNFNGNYGYQPEAPKSKTLAIVGFVLGIVGLIAWCIPLTGYPVGLAGAIISGISMGKCNAKVFSIIGLILSILCLILSLINSILGVAMSGAFNY